MNAKSFYDLDYIIEINEQRLTQSSGNYEKAVARLTNILVIYSALTIFLIPALEDWINTKIIAFPFYVALILFLIIFLCSIYYTIRLLVPNEVASLVKPKRYYSELRKQYESEYQKQPAEVDLLLKASYIDELEKALDTNRELYNRKAYFYQRALFLALISAIPYLVCLGFHFTVKNDQIQKVQIVPAAGK